ncbi:CheR family methyltransferase [Yanghanlia caeni]|uniref:Chemotaxis protein methyltransferase n=1 Tax=Yanghanlia caeni TaxID=3064283 RepID=A0ABU1D3T8_9BURK|nr:CheR family methyltransferase [Alcaligenaceae bacterium LG-2]HZH57094.1 CheR family methyltransferase [Burkholderiaceae bacterium]
MNAPHIFQPFVVSDSELALFQTLFKQQIGLHLSDEKKALLASRLESRLMALGLSRFHDYYRFITGPGEAAAEELQQAIDLITTNETYFFREPAHFEFLSQSIVPATRADAPFSVWSAASASGEEAYSIAMVLHDTLGDAPWRVLGSDVSQRVLRSARRGMYPLSRCEHIPQPYLKRYCLRGVDEYTGQLLVERSLRERVSFVSMNLTRLPDTLGQFDVIFLRNVIIYFDLPTKIRVLESVLRYLRPGGYLITGHSESLHGVCVPLEAVASAIYRKPVNP